MHRSDTIAIAKLAQTGRSSTLAAPFNLKESLAGKPDRDSSRRSHLLHSHKHHHHAHHGHHHHRHPHRSSKYGGDEKEIKSAVLPPSRTPFADPALEGNGGSTKSGGSGSGNDLRDLVSPSVVAEYDAGMRRVSSRVVRPEDVARERARQKQREEQLRAALHALDEQSMATTRHLDDTYYAILEKVAGLHGTIDGLQELSTLTRKLGHEFAQDADDVVDEVNHSLDGIGDFEAQARLLGEFEARIAAGKEKAARLNERLERARKRVEERERLEEEWRASVNRRLRIFWGVLAAVTALFLVVYVVYGIRTQKQRDAAAPGANVSRANHSVDLDSVVVPPPVREILDSVRSSPATSKSPPPLVSDAVAQDERLHVFDEL
ncbi:hypothetical protein GTA08_BOTSDO02422 [Neofusicoccum parvum]|nr:hypothetical protein GTA08_BOTSDO02422 [Neofusicoccum parvum]